MSERKSAGGYKSPIQADWDAIKHEYVNGSATTHELAKKYGINPKTVETRCTRKKWADERGMMRDAAAMKAKDEQAEKRARLMVEFNDADIKMAQALRTLVARSMTAYPEGAPIPGAELRALAATCETAQKIGRLALGFSTDNRELSGKVGVVHSGGVMIVRDHGSDAQWEADLKAQQERLIAESGG